MFAARYYAPRYYAPRYFPKVGDVLPIIIARGLLTMMGAG